MHTLVQLQQLTRQEFLRGLQGISDEDARKRVEPMNCISWIVAHMAAQERAFFVAWPQGKDVDSQYQAYGTGSSPSQPPMEETMALWHKTCDEADACLHAATEEDMQRVFPEFREENAGTLLVRNIFHYWSHIGEVSAIRQVLGHEKPPQFVNMHGWLYSKG